MIPRINYRYKIFVIASLVIILLAGRSYADNLKSEIDHLIKFVKQSHCIFIRNSVEHNPEEAGQHILKKYGYFRNRISTTEEFIEYCATKSTMTGRFYEIACHGKPRVRSKDWLLEELRRFRKDLKNKNP